MSDQFAERVSSELEGVVHRVAPMSPEADYVDYGDGIRTPPGGEPVEEYVDYGDGIRTPPTTEQPPPEDYVDYGDGIRTPPADPPADGSTSADLVGEAVRMAGAPVIPPTPIASVAGTTSHAEHAFGSGVAEVDPPLADSGAFGTGDLTAPAPHLGDTSDPGADPGDGEAFADAVDPVGAVAPDPLAGADDGFGADLGFEAGDAPEVVDEVGTADAGAADDGTDDGMDAFVG